MTCAEEQLELVPFDKIPEPEVILAGISDVPSRFEFTDIFPDLHKTDLDGGLGDYTGGEPLHDSPLYHVAKGVRAFRYMFVHEEEANGWVRTDRTTKGKAAALLQTVLIQRVNQAYVNLQGGGYDSEDAAEKISEYVDSRVEKVTIDYCLGLGRMALDLAALKAGEPLQEPTEIKGIPVISTDMFDKIYGRVLRSPEVKREEEMRYLRGRIKLVLNRTERLRFEQLSTLAILEYLK